MPVPAWLANLVLLAASVLAPLAGILLNVAFDLGGILVTIALIVWMGFALVLLAPLME